MSDTHSSGSTGAFQHSKKSKRANPYGYLRALIDDNPDASRSELDEMSADIILKQIANGDHAMFHAIHTYWLTNCYKNLTREPSTDDDAEASTRVPNKGHGGPASASSPEATTEAMVPLPDEGRLPNASASPTAGGAIHVVPDEGRDASAPPVRPPARGPTEAELRGALLAENAAANTVLDTYLIDGKPLGDWTRGEAKLKGKQKTREGLILLYAAGRDGPDRPDDKLLRDIVTPDAMNALKQKAEEEADRLAKETADGIA